MTNDCANDRMIDATDHQQAADLRILLGINAGMFFAEFISGVIGQSTALISDSLDMLADATVYAISLYAVGRAAGVKITAARLSGIAQVLLGIGVLIDVTRRFIYGSEPLAVAMIGVGVMALIANVICLLIIAKHRDGEIHMRASWIFSKNDVIANVGVITGGLLTYIFSVAYFDLLIGVLIALIVIRGGIQIVNSSKVESQIVISDE